MQFCYLAFFEKPDAPAARISRNEIALLRNAVAGLKRLSKAHFYTPAITYDIYADDGPSPFFGMQLYFETLADLETAIGKESPLTMLAEGDDLPALKAADATQQAMLNRSFPVPENAPIRKTACSYVVHYPGPAQDLNEWLSFYVANHPSLMARFPGVREIEILSRLDWIGAIPWRRVDHMQRNRILFDSPQALTDALHSPVRHEMRRDFERFPPYGGGNFHYPMLTEVVLPA